MSIVLRKSWKGLNLEILISYRVSSTNCCIEHIRAFISLFVNKFLE